MPTVAIAATIKFCLNIVIPYFFTKPSEQYYSTLDFSSEGGLYPIVPNVPFNAT
jgi:hypothetical protein